MHEPLTLQPLLVERIWGEQTLHEWYSQPEPGKPIGEVWLTAENCVVEGTTTTLRALVAEKPAAFEAKADEGFPLLIKLLYPKEKLSVQVHPNDAQARQMLGEPRGKTECWYVLSAEPGAQLALGFTEPMDSAMIQQAIADGTIESKLRYIPVKAGDMVFVDAGTVHAIGPGMVVLETQQYSDVTYRLWDYGRPRALHLDAGLAVARADTKAGLVPSQEMEGFTRLITCRYFTVDSFRMRAADRKALGTVPGMQILLALGAGAHVQTGGESFPLKAGCAVLLPRELQNCELVSEQPVEVMRILATGA